MVETCARCDAPLTEGEAYCLECGAPVGEAAPAADSAVHGDLARANLMRLRGDLDGSEKALLGILRRFPNDPHAHELLGDVCAERGERDRAVEWYELALDLSPTNADVRRKLEETRAEKETQTVADTAEVLGLPPVTPKAAWWPLAAAGALLVLAILVAAWPRGSAVAPLRQTVVAPAPATTQAVASNVNVAPETTPTPVPETATTVVPTTGDDARLLEALKTGTEGTRVQGVVLDPRTGTLTVSYLVGEAEDPQPLAIALGRAALATASTATTVTLRALRGGHAVFLADLPRASMETENPLTSVWPTPTNPGGATDAGSVPPATTGTTEPIGSTGMVAPTTTTTGSTASPTTTGTS